VGPALTTVQTVGDPLPTTCLSRSASPSSRPLRRAAHSGNCRRGGPVGRGAVEIGSAQHVPHRRRRDAVTEPNQLAVDAAMTPGPGSPAPAQPPQP
jgi:hypothetical protein